MRMQHRLSDDIWTTILGNMTSCGKLNSARLFQGHVSLNNLGMYEALQHQILHHVDHHALNLFNGHFRNLNWRYLPSTRPI